MASLYQSPAREFRSMYISRPHVSWEPPAETALLLNKLGLFRYTPSSHCRSQAVGREVGNVLISELGG
jgi:hypothetical protein